MRNRRANFLATSSCNNCCARISIYLHFGLFLALYYFFNVSLINIMLSFFDGKLCTFTRLKVHCVCVCAMHIHTYTKRMCFLRKTKCSVFVADAKVHYSIFSHLFPRTHTHTHLLSVIPKCQFAFLKVHFRIFGKNFPGNFFTEFSWQHRWKAKALIRKQSGYFCQGANTCFVLRITADIFLKRSAIYLGFCWKNLFCFLLFTWRLNSQCFHCVSFSVSLVLFTSCVSVARRIWQSSATSRRAEVRGVVCDATAF